MRKSEVREMPSLPRGGGDELVRDEQVSSRRVRPRSLPVWGGGGLPAVYSGGRRTSRFEGTAAAAGRTQTAHCVCVRVCMCVFFSFTETTGGLFEQAAEDGHVPQISPHGE